MKNMKRYGYKKVNQFDRRRPFSRKNAAEFRSGKKEFAQCPDCKNVYYKKSWHHNLNQKSKIKNQKYFRFELCPACKMTKDNLFEGEIIIENIFPEIKKELLNIIKNSDKQARANDPQDRVLRIKEHGNTTAVYTSENQLAKRVARRIKDAYTRKVKQKISYSKGEDVVRVHLTFL